MVMGPDGIFGTCAECGIRYLIDSDNDVGLCDMCRSPEHSIEVVPPSHVQGGTGGKKALIAEINRRVALSQDGDNESMEWLLRQFEALIVSVTKKFYIGHANLISWEELYVWSRSEFTKLTLHDYTIGGPAYYNVFVKRMLSIRALDKIERLMRDQNRNVLVGDPSVLDALSPCVDDNTDAIIARLDAKSLVDTMLDHILNNYTKFDYDIFHAYFFLPEQNYKTISAMFGISETRVVNRISTIKKDLRLVFGDMVL